MKGKFNLIIGLIALTQVIYYLVNCPTVDCEGSIFGFPIPGFAYLLIWGFITVSILYGVYKDNKAKT